MAKIFNVGLNAVRIGHTQPLSIGPGFYINTLRSIQGMVPFLADAASTGIGNPPASFTVNFGQNTFQGDPKGFLAYDPNYNSTLWVGNYSFGVDANTIRVGNLGRAYYNLEYESGKYYYEVTYNADTNADFIGMGISSQVSTSGDIRYYALGMFYLGSYRSDTTTMREISGVYSSNDPWSTYNVLGGDTVQVWVDFDNDIMCVKKLNTTKEEHIDYIEQ